MKMENDLKELKSMLRSLVVSSPTEVDLRTLLRDYRNMMGEPIPITKFGYRDGLTFIKERCNDCFVIRDSSSNPVLTVIVPDSVKHIDNFVQRQKSSNTRFKGKRRSLPEAAFKEHDLVVKTFKPKHNNLNNMTDYTKVEKKKQIIHEEPSNKCIQTDHNEVASNRVSGIRTDDAERTNGVCSSNALQNFMKKRMPMFSSSQNLDSDSCLDKDSSKGDTDSGRQTASSNSSSKRTQLEELKTEIREVVGEMPEGVWCTELMKLYREKYGRELNFSRFGYTSVVSLAYAVEGLRHSTAEHSGDVLLQACATDAGAGEAGAGGAVRHRAAPAAHAPARPLRTGDPDDALPGIDFDEDVFPRDCMHQMQSVPAQPLDELAAGAMLEVVLGEVYSPTHFWMLRLGPNHYSAMEALMDEMNTYYRGEGRERVLAGGALRVGHYCACCYCGDWHRAVIVKILDSDTVKVRHIDYATVETVAARALKPLLRRWAALPAQAVRARLAGARPPAAGRRWPWASSSHFLHLIRERQLVAYVVAKDAQEGILEVLLIDTSTEDDVCISTEMCRSGHADPRPDSALGTSECYLFPRFDALETGDTPNYAEIYCYLRDGISLDYVEDYRRHVPSCLPPPAPLVPSPPPSPPPPPPPAPSQQAAPPRTRSPLLPTPTVPSTPPRPALLPTPSAQSTSPWAAGATRSLGQLSERPGAAHTTRAASLSPSLESQRRAARVQPPPRSPRPNAAQSVPPGTFSAPSFPPYPPMHLSPFAPPFYPQQPYPPQPYPPPPPPPPPPSPFVPGPFPVFMPSPLPPPSPAPPGGVSIPASECEIFTLLSRVDPGAAHRYMLDALARALVCSSQSRAAPRVCAETQTESALRPPPGFEHVVPRAPHAPHAPSPPPTSTALTP